ncbi:nucleotide disphospho-sugar-binding domain-containing protein [Mycobacterium sp. 236(2023)]|uniref:glycosyltransferase n=1 Tax=Mycobacterium sp. 236(2023) TaxID=3038163 RepID=UPI002415517F|nr:nucleotide disphospho-sugar-binding domain-containing protein [Mycobacterium sp. 236(2023)]MDG4667512.1 glycosyltransferase [Mycobacterium sp. 236(2023)]
MADVLFVTMDGGGNVPPLLAVASAVAAGGHSVRVAGHECLDADVTRAGLPFAPYRTARRWDSRQAQSPLRWVPMFNDHNIADDVDRLCAERRPDVAVVDCMLLPALKKLQRNTIRTVVLTHTFRSYMNRMHRYGAGTAALLYGHRITSLWNGADLNLVATLERLDPDARRRRPPNLRWVGAVVSGRPAQPDSGSPLVLVSMSTNGFRGQRATLARVIEALSGLPVRAVVTTGGVIDPADLPSAPNVEVVGFVDHADLMPKCSLLIGHGGHATTLRALAHDIPVLVLPASALSDQRLIGAAVARSGAGILASRSSSVSTLRADIDALLTEPRWRQAAADVGQDLRAVDAAREAADLIVALASSVR